MSRLRIFDERHGDAPLQTVEEHARIVEELGKVGVRFEQWQATAPVNPGDSPEVVLDAYHKDIDRLQREHGYKAVDVISLDASSPQKDALRQKFLSEHTHAEDEVRFFVAGEGLFTLHIEDRVYEILCRQGDLIGVPDGTRHWFDMGPNPGFVAIRLFTNPEGWVAQFTGDPIALRFPRLQN